MGPDPVCGMEVNPTSAAAQSEFQGVTFYFCAEPCKWKFDVNPMAYVNETDLAEARARRASER